MGEGQQAFKRIEEADLTNKGVVGQENTPGLSAREMQEKVEEIARKVIIPAFNVLVDALVNGEAAKEFAVTKPEGLPVETKNNLNDVLAAIGEELVKRVVSEDIKKMRLNQFGELEVSTNGDGFAIASSRGHVVLDDSGHEYEQRRKLRFKDTTVEDDPAKDETVITGIIGPEGPRGPAGVTTELSTGFFGMYINDNGELVLVYNQNDQVPPLSLKNGQLVYTVSPEVEIQLGQVIGPQGKGVAGVKLDNRGHIIITLSNPINGQEEEIDVGAVDTTNALVAAKQSITEAGQNAVSTVEKKENTAVSTIDGVATQALQELAQIKVQSLQEVNSTKTQALNKINQEGEKQVKRLGGILPTPTAENNGKIPTVMGDKYELQDPVPSVEDANISSKSPWSSKKTVDALCSPFNQKAAVVHGELVADYPMSVKSYIEPVQEGSGDPSPENKRPIHGVTKLTAYKCGKNLINLPSYTAKVYNSVLPRAEYEALYASLEALPSGQYRTSGSLSVQLRIDYQGGGNVTFRSNSQSGEVKQGKISTVRLYVGAYGDSFPQTVTNVQLEVGSTPTPYELYSGETYSQPLPEEVFGGVYNWDTGELTKTAYPFKITNSNRLLCWGVNRTTPGVTGFYVFFRDLLGGQIPPWLIASDALPVACDWLIPDKYDAILGKKANKCTISVGGDSSYIAISVANELIGVSAETSADAAIEVMKQYLSAHPLTVIAKCSPILVSTLDKATILAQSGTTTVYSNSGDTEVTARKDPAAERKTLEERLAALEKAAAQF